MKKMLGLMVAATMLLGAFGAAQNDLRYTFWSQGPDSYRDGTAVLDGEFYALVWVKEGETFGGFNADGSLASASNRLVVEGPYARGGKCKHMVHLVTPTEAAQYAGGNFQLHLLDTRRADGSLSGYTVGADNSYAPKMVNGYQSVYEVSSAAAALSVALGVRSPICIENVSVVPTDAPTPKITGVKMRRGVNGQEMVITVKGTAAYLNYTVASGVTPSALTSTDVGVTGEADAEKEIEIVVPATGASGFFKVIRK